MCSSDALEAHWLPLVFLPVFSNPSQFGDGLPSVGRPTMIGVGERRGVGSGVNAGRGDVAVGLGLEFETRGVRAGVADVLTAEPGCDVGRATVCGGWGSLSTSWPDSKILAMFSRLISNSILPLGGGGGGASCLPFNEISTLSAKPR